MNEQIRTALPVRRKKCRHGVFSYFAEDQYVGLSLEMYGEYSEAETRALTRCIRPGEVVVEVGANIGALTVPMARAMGVKGKLIAFEPNPDNHRLLLQNLKDNLLESNVQVLNMAASSSAGMTHVENLQNLGHHNYGCVTIDAKVDGIEIRMITIDSLNLERCNVMKIDVEGHEREVLEGARETIKRCQPIIWVENDRDDKSEALIATLVDMGYRCYWHRPPLWNPDNFEGERRNVFGQVVSINMCCVPELSRITLHNSDEVADIRMDDQIFDREAKRFDQRSARNPDDLMARLLAAHYHNCMQRSDIALELIEENLRRDPEHAPSRSIRGLIRLQQGDYEKGWQDYELRQLQPHKRYFGGHREFAAPQWDGTPTNATVLVSAQQGFGDNIMFARYFKYVQELAPNAILEVPTELYELFEQSRVAPEGKLYRYGRTLPYYQFYCPSPSLPAVLKDDGSLMEIDRPYLFADDTLLDHWRKWNIPNYGICPKGSAFSERPYTRDLPDAALAPFLRKYGPYFHLGQTGQFQNFADTAAAIMALDLVITVDTSVAHLAGALGQRTWLLLSFDPDWRWGLKHSVTPWYPTMRIFRQERVNNWSDVMEALDWAMEHR